MASLFVNPGRVKQCARPCQQAYGSACRCACKGLFHGFLNDTLVWSQASLDTPEPKRSKKSARRYAKKKGSFYG